MRDRGSNKLGTRLAACALWIGAWQAASLFVGNSILVAGPVETLARLGAIVCGETFLPVVWFSLARIGAGFLLAFALGVGLALVAHRHPLFGDLLAPFVLLCKSVPVACVVVLLLIWMGSRAVSGMAVFLMAFPAIYLAMLEGLASADQKVAELLRVFSVGRVRGFLAHRWPSALPYLTATCKNACGMAWKAGVAAELIGAPLGSLGERVYQAKILLETADLFAWTIVIVAASFAFEQVFVRLLRESGAWALRASLAGKGHHAVTEPATIELVDLSFGYDPEAPAVLDHTSMSCAPGELVLLDGASGSGKTTLLGIVMGLLAPRAGRVEAPARLSVVFQESRLIEQMSARQNVLLVSKGSLDDANAGRLLRELLPEELLDRPVSELSGGQRRRVEIVRALAHPSGAVLLDEPFASLDAQSHAEAASFVRRHLEGRPLIVASHDPQDRELLGK